jgi:hypothetical protein
MQSGQPQRGSDEGRSRIAPSGELRYSTRLVIRSLPVNRDVPQEVVRVLLDHDSHMMTAHYARLSETTIRRHWEAAQKVNIKGEAVTLDPTGRSPTRPGPSSGSAVSPRHCPTATAACRYRRPARMQTVV